LGLAVIAAERLRGLGVTTGSATPGAALNVGVGLAQQTADELRVFARRVARPSARMATSALDWATSHRPLNTGPLGRSRARLTALVDNARDRGRRTVAAGRSDADAVLRAGVSEGMAWAQAQAVPQIVDGLVPHLVDNVVPQLIDGVMPEIREKVLPIIIDDLASDPQLRELILEQSRGVVGGAAEELRTATATADDRVEKAFRRLLGGGTTVDAAEQGEPAREG
jgi:hypothetical protein